MLDFQGNAFINITIQKAYIGGAAWDFNHSYKDISLEVQYRKYCQLLCLIEYIVYGSIYVIKSRCPRDRRPDKNMSVVKLKIRIRNSCVAFPGSLLVNLFLVVDLHYLFK